MDSLTPPVDRGGPAQPLLLATGLRKHFPVPGGLLGRSGKVVRAVDDLSLSVAKGETLRVVGESGCGKSTVGRLVLRLLEPTAGAVRFEGDDLLALDQAALRARRRQAVRLGREGQRLANGEPGVE